MSIETSRFTIENFELICFNTMKQILYDRFLNRTGSE